MANKQMEIVLSAFRAEVTDLESFGDEAIKSLKTWRQVSQTLDTLHNLCEQVGYPVPEAFNTVYEHAANQGYNPNEVSENRRKAEGMLIFAEDFGMDKGEIVDLLARYDAAMDKVGSAAEPEKAKGVKAGTTGRYGNTADAFRSDSLGGIKRHLTRMLPGWYADGKRVTDGETTLEDEGKPTA